MFLNREKSCATCPAFSLPRCAALCPTRPPLTRLGGTATFCTGARTHILPLSLALLGNMLHPTLDMRNAECKGRN